MKINIDAVIRDGIILNVINPRSLKKLSLLYSIISIILLIFLKNEISV